MRRSNNRWYRAESSGISDVSTAGMWNSSFQPPSRGRSCTFFRVASWKWIRKSSGTEVSSESSPESPRSTSLEVPWVTVARGPSSVLPTLGIEFHFTLRSHLVVSEEPCTEGGLESVLHE